MYEKFCEAWLSHRVSYGETDAMGVVYYAEYFHYFERARSELGRSAGVNYKIIEKAGAFLPVRDAQCRYHSPARYDDLLQIHVKVTEIRRASVRFEYEIFDEGKEILICRGSTLHAVTNIQGVPIPVPDIIKNNFIQNNIDEAQ